MDDWRETFARNAEGAGFTYRAFGSPVDATDHDHCAACWTKFSADKSMGVTEGHASVDGEGRPDGRFWVCDECFRDLASRMSWRDVRMEAH